MAPITNTTEADTRERARRNAALPARLESLSAQIRGAYDTRPVSRAEWNAASCMGEDFEAKEPPAAGA